MATELRIAEHAVGAEPEQFRLLVESVSDYAIYLLDNGGHVRSWNAGVQRIKGYAPGEIVGQHFSRFYTEADRANGKPQRALQIAGPDVNVTAQGAIALNDTGASNLTVHAESPSLDRIGDIIGQPLKGSAILDATIDTWTGPRQEAGGLGAISPEDWQASIDYLTTLGLVPSPVVASVTSCIAA